MCRNYCCNVLTDRQPLLRIVGELIAEFVDSVSVAVTFLAISIENSRNIRNNDDRSQGSFTAVMSMLSDLYMHM